MKKLYHMFAISGEISSSEFAKLATTVLSNQIVNQRENKPNFVNSGNTLMTGTYLFPKIVDWADNSWH
jgi:hypothetical protein